MNYKQIERKRKAFERFGKALFRRALNKQVAPAIHALKEGLGNPEDYITPEPIRTAYQKLYYVVMPEFGKDITQRFQKSISLKRDDLQEPNWDDVVNRYVNISLASRITGVSDYTKEIVERVIRESIENNLSIPQTVKALKAKWVDISKYRATMIARTEIITASNAGSYSAAVASHIPMIRTWLATGGKRTRDAHAMAHGQKTDLKGNYIVGGELMKYPGDPRASAANVVNCRCAETYDVVEGY